VESTCWANRRGYGRHARSLLAAALAIDRANQYVFFIDSGQDGQDLPGGGEVVRVPTSVPVVMAAGSNGRRALADMWAMSRALAQPDLDCLFFPTVYSYVPVMSQAYKIVMIHDVIPEKFPAHVFPSASGRLNWKVKSWVARGQADLILTVSEFSRRGIIEHFGEPPGRVKVVGEANDAVFRVIEDPKLPDALARQGLTPKDRLIVFVGGFSPHKNLPGLLDAFAGLAGRMSDIRLVLVGDYKSDSFHSCYQQVKRRAGQPPLEGRVVFAGYLPDEDLAALLNLATALALPSYLEGFGLPAIEAAACGLPVVATSASPLPELLRDAALFVSPGDTQGLAAALERLLTDTALRERMRDRGLRAAAALSWKRAAEELLVVFESVARHHGKTA
jgi:glycosyltransferase involved in cell wall biosynthesis